MIRRRRVVCALGALLFAWMAPALAEADESPAVIRLVSDEWPGFNNRDGSGLAWDIMRLIFEPAGLKVEYRTEVYTRGVGLVQRGEADAWLGSYADEGFERVVYPRESYGLEPVGALGLASTPVPTLQSIGGYRLSWMRGYAYDRHLQVRARHEEVLRRDGILDMLDRERTDYYLDPLPALEGVLAKAADPSRYRITTLAAVPLYPGFADSPKGRSLAELYDRRLHAIKADGSLRRLYRRWHVEYLFDRYPEQSRARP